MCHSSKFNSKSYEAKTLLNQIKHYDEEERGISYLIQDKKEFLKSYIDGKEKMYQKIRKARNN
jgi:CHASE3 domain sensor protein